MLSDNLIVNNLFITNRKAVLLIIQKWSIHLSF